MESVPLARFLGFYTLVLTVLYSAITYKTPWCLLGFLHGMTLLAGLGAWLLLRHTPTLPGKLAVGAVILILLGHLGRETYWLNFRLPADQRNPWVYAHSSADVLNLARQIDRLAAVAPEGEPMWVHVVTPENYWPLPWYFRRLDPDRVGFWHDAAAWRAETKDRPAPSAVIVTADVQAEVEAGLRAAHPERVYQHRMTNGLRPGVLVMVYVPDDLWAKFTAAAAAKPGP